MAYELKTKKNKKHVNAYIKEIGDAQRRKDAKSVHTIMKEITGDTGAMWGESIAGYGSYSYISSAKKEYSWFMVGWSSRVQNLTIYIMPGYQDMDHLLQKLGPHKKGKSCLYIKRLDDIHLPTLKRMIKRGVSHMRKNYRTSV